VTKPGKPEKGSLLAVLDAESRNVSNIRWHSDVIPGCLIGAGTVARLHADPAFRADIEAARGELAAVRVRGLKPMRDCTAEASAPALQPH
jgi:acid phosphatase (class A)